AHQLCPCHVHRTYQDAKYVAVIRRNELDSVAADNIFGDECDGNVGTSRRGDLRDRTVINRGLGDLAESGWIIGICARACGGALQAEFPHLFDAIANEWERAQLVRLD